MSIESSEKSGDTELPPKVRRQEGLMRAVEQDGHATVSFLSERFGVSEMTIRRDLEQLESQGRLARINSGAIRKQGRAVHPPFSTRVVTQVGPKSDIAEAAANEVKDGDSVALDVGTTVIATIKPLTRKADLTIVATSVRVAAAVLDHFDGRNDVQLITTGGVISPRETLMHGALALAALDEMRVDHAFLGASGIDVEEGLTDFSVESAQMKRSLMRNAKRTTVLVDSTKFGEVNFARICDSSEIDVIVTDDNIGQAHRLGFEQLGTRVVVSGHQPNKSSITDGNQKSLVHPGRD